MNFPVAMRPTNTGFSLVELIVVVSILAITAGSAYVAVEGTRKVAVDASADEVIQALRFARQEAERLRLPTVLQINSANRTLNIHALDFSTSPATQKQVNHPLRHKSYSVALGNFSLINYKLAVTASFAFEDGTTASEVGFDVQGSPVKLVSGSSSVPLKTTGLWRGAWQPGGFSYKAGDWVEHNGKDYDCIQGHNSSSDFSSDLNASRWAVRTTPAQVKVSAGTHKRDIHLAPITGFARLGAP